jgi:hypothetical protein
MTSQETIASNGIKRDGEHRDTWFLDASTGQQTSTDGAPVTNRSIEWISFEPSDGAVVLYSAGATHVVWHFVAALSVLRDSDDAKRVPTSDAGLAAGVSNGHLDDFHLDAELTVTFTELSARRFDEQQQQQQQQQQSSWVETKGATTASATSKSLMAAAAAAGAAGKKQPQQQLSTPLKVIRTDRAHHVLDPGSRSIDVWWCMELPQQWVQHNEKQSQLQGGVELASQDRALSWHTVLFPRRRLNIYTNCGRRLKLRIVSNEFALSDRAYQNPLRRRPMMVDTSPLVSSNFSKASKTTAQVTLASASDMRNRSIWTHLAQATVLIVPVAAGTTVLNAQQKQDVELWKLLLTRRLGVPKKQVSIFLVNELDTERQQWQSVLERFQRQTENATSPITSGEDASSAGSKDAFADVSKTNGGVCLIRATHAIPHTLFTLSAWEAELWLIWATLSSMREQSLREQSIVCLSGNNLSEQQQLLDLKQQPSSPSASSALSAAAAGASAVRSASPSTMVVAGARTAGAATAGGGILTPQDRRHPMQLTSLVTFLPRLQIESFLKIPSAALTVAQWLDRQGEKVLRPTPDLVILK